MIANIFGGDGLYVIIIALVVLVGGSQLPKIARNVGLAGKEFRNAQAEAEEDAAKKKAKKGDPAALAAPAAPEVPAPVAQAVPVVTAAPAPAAPAPAPAPAAPASAAPAPAAAGADPAISLTPAQLDALLKAREDQVRNESANPSVN